MDLEPVETSFAELEETITRGLATFVEVGNALMEIRDRRLYRDAGFQRFEDYCKVKWHWGRSRAEQLITAAKTVQAIEDHDPVTIVTPTPPTTESQARELATLKEPEKIQAVWNTVQETAKEEGTVVTAKKIKEEVERVNGTEGRKHTRIKAEPQPLVKPTEDVQVWLDLLQNAVRALQTAVDLAANTEYKAQIESLCKEAQRVNSLIRLSLPQY